MTLVGPVNGKLKVQNARQQPQHVSCILNEAIFNGVLWAVPDYYTSVVNVNLCEFKLKSDLAGNEALAIMGPFLRDLLDKYLRFLMGEGFSLRKFLFSMARSVSLT